MPIETGAGCVSASLVSCRSVEMSIAGFFGGPQLVEPGIVPCSRWRPEPTQVGAVADVPQLAALARTP